MRLLRR